MVIVFQNGYCLAQLPLILSAKRSILIGMERNNILKRYETSPLNLTGTRCRGETVHIMLWMHGRAYLSQLWLNCVEKDCFLKMVVN